MSQRRFDAGPNAEAARQQGDARDLNDGNVVIPAGDGDEAETAMRRQRRIAQIAARRAQRALVDDDGDSNDPTGDEAGLTIYTLQLQYFHTIALGDREPGEPSPTNHPEFG